MWRASRCRSARESLFRHSALDGLFLDAGFAPRQQFAWESLHLSPKYKHHSRENAQKGSGVVPANRLVQIEVRENNEDRQSDGLLDDLQLISGEVAIANAIGRNLKTIFAKRDQLANDDDFQKWRGAMFQVPIPREGHKHVGNDEKQYGKHAT